MKLLSQEVVRVRAGVQQGGCRLLRDACMESIRTWSAGRYRRFQEGSATESSRKHALEPAQLFPSNTKEDVKRDVELVRLQSGTVRHLA